MDVVCTAVSPVEEEADTVVRVLTGIADVGVGGTNIGRINGVSVVSYSFSSFGEIMMVMSKVTCLCGHFDMAPSVDAKIGHARACA
jgi:hypothetical protein